MECMKKESSPTETTPSAETASCDDLRGLGPDAIPEMQPPAEPSAEATPSSEGGVSRQLFGGGAGGISEEEAEPRQLSGKTHIFQCGTDVGKVEVSVWSLLEREGVVLRGQIVESGVEKEGGRGWC
jgi:hypothetical protein